MLEYVGRDKLYVPVDRLDYLEKYWSAESATPKLDRLGRVGARSKAGQEVHARHGAGALEALRRAPSKNDPFLTGASAIKCGYAAREI